MEKLTPITIPLINPNEPEALLAALEVVEGDRVEPGQVLALVETTKSTAEILAEQAGYLVGLRYAEGETLHAGDVLAYIGKTPESHDPKLPPWGKDTTKKVKPTPQPSGLRITEPARELALAEGLDLQSLPQGPLITREAVQALLQPQASGPTQPIPAGENRILIYGAGGHGRTLAALIQTLDRYEILGFLDDGYEPGESVLGLPILGGKDQLEELAQQGVRMAVNGIGGIADLQIRLAVFVSVKAAGFHCPGVVHPTALVEQSTKLSDGSQVFAFAYIGTEALVDDGCIINTSAIVSHNCTLSRYVNLSPGATLAGGVFVGERTLIGMRATVNLNVHIGTDARIGNGATVKADVPDGGIVPAGSIWPPRGI
jgi:sugar O-acyltransferase (sialic acid O-acetyltransferase NeuD family)